MSKRLFETIVDASAGAGSFTASEHEDSLPIALLSCVDPRLTSLLPTLVPVPQEQLLWLRHPGNMIVDPLGAAARSLVLATVLRPIREVAIIGHDDCAVCQTSVLQLTDRFKALGIDRARLPDDLVGFFGLFASETQNVRRAVEVLTASPIFSVQIPVHGLLIRFQSKRLEWVVNGYQALESRPSPSSAPAPALPGPDTLLGQSPQIPEPKGQPTPPEQPQPEPAQPSNELTVTRLLETLGKEVLFNILGSDRRVYGPVSAEKLLGWLKEGRIDGSTPARQPGQAQWKPLAELVKLPHPPPLPPTLAAVERLWKRVKR